MAIKELPTGFRNDTGDLQSQVPGVALMEATTGKPVSDTTPLPIKIVSANGVTIEVNEADLANVGAKADAPAADDTGAYSILAFIKRALQNWTTLLAAVATGGVTVKSGAGAAVSATIANGQTLSPMIDLGNQRLGRIGCPAALDGNTTLSFETSHDGVTSRPLFDEYGSEYTIVIGASRSVVPDLTKFAAARWIKVRFGKSTAAGTAATANRTFDISTLA